MNTAVDGLEQRDKKRSLLLLLGIILVGSNLRVPLTSIGSIIGFIRDDLDLTNAAVGTLTTLPLIAFALFSPLAPKIAYRFGMEKTLFVSLILLFIGLTARVLFGATFLFVGTVIIGIAIAFGNVLIPGFIKLAFPYRVGIVMGLYTVSMNLFSAIASGVSVPISNANPFGWRGALWAVAILTILAIIVWLPQLLKPLSSQSDQSVKTGKLNLWRSSLAWQVTLFLGLQSIVFYAIVTWLPEILVSHGYSSTKAGWTLSLMQFSFIILTFITPIIAGNMKSQRLLSAIALSLYIIGLFGLVQGNSLLIPLSAIVIGLGAGSAFSLAMMFFALRTSSGHEAAELSGMAQSVGYLLAAVGPIVFGGVYDLTTNWTTPLVMLIVISIICLFTGIGAGRNKLIENK